MKKMDSDNIEYDNSVQSQEDDGQTNSINISDNEEEQEQEKQRRSKLQDHIEWRRGKVAELRSQGFTIRDIAGVLKVSKSLIQLDVQFIREQARSNSASYNERLPHEFESVMTGITSILRRSILESQVAADTKTKVMCLNLAKDCYSMKLDLITNLNMLETAVKFLDEHKKTKESFDEKTLSSEAASLPVETDEEDAKNW